MQNTTPANAQANVPPGAALDPQLTESIAWHHLEQARTAIGRLPQAARTYQLQRIDATIDEFGKQEYERRMRLRDQYPPQRTVPAAYAESLHRTIADLTDAIAEANRDNADFGKVIDELRAKLAQFEPPPPPASAEKPAEKSVAQPIAQE